MKVKGYTPKEWQTQVHSTLAEIEQARVENALVLCKSKRQCGKSLMATQVILDYSLNYGRQRCILLSPTLKQARKIFKDIIVGLRRADGVVENANGSLLEITFCNGSEVAFLSGEMRESLRGFTISEHGILIIDEAAYIADEIWGIVAPFCNVFRRPILAISTPRYCTGKFYEFWTSREPNVFRIDWTEYNTSDFLSQSALDFFRKTLPRQQFTMDYEGQFVSLSSNTFGDLSAVINDSPDLNGDYYIGVDWSASKGNDYNAVAVFNSQSQMIECSTWNNTDETETIRKILFIIEKWQPRRVVVERNSIGNVFFGLLEKQLQERRINTELSTFLTTNESKNDLVAKLQVAIQNKEITLLNDEELIAELSAFSPKMTSGGRVTYEASVGHDDLVMATMFAFNAISEGTYFVS